MSATRKAKDDSVFHQNRYASSPEFERGMIANLVAKRCSILDDQADRELIWFVQYLSHQAGGLAGLAKSLIARYADRFQTPAMSRLGAKPGKIFNADQVKSIRNEFPILKRTEFLLEDEDGILDVVIPGEKIQDAAINTAIARACCGSDCVKNKSKQHPSSYPAQSFIDFCQAEAARSLENYLGELCVNPAARLDAGPWYFPKAIATLRDCQAAHIKSKMEGAFCTALGKKVFEVLDYTAYCRGLSLIEGEARLGKSHAGRAWCEQHPGRARFIEVPTGNDELIFFRALARGLGLGNFLSYKTAQIRERVESVLLSGDIVLVLDEAQRLWPQTNLREGYPKRIAWVMTMANASVPICMISTPQFFSTQKMVEKNGWNSAQLTGRISHYEPLPADLSQDDLMAVAKNVLPEANTQSLRALALYARTSARYLAAIDSIAKRARYIAMQADRAAATTADVRRAMQESVIPADTKLHLALAATATGKLAKLKPVAALPVESAVRVDAPGSDEQEISPEPSRLAHVATGSRTRAGNIVSLIEA